MSDDEEDDEWWYHQREHEQWVDSNAARRQAAWLFIWIVAIFLAVSLFALVMWMLHGLIFVPGAPEELLPQ